GPPSRPASSRGAVNGLGVGNRRPYGRTVSRRRDNRELAAHGLDPVAHVDDSDSARRSIGPYSNAVILDRQLDCVLAGVEGNRHFGAGSGVLDGILDGLARAEVQ